MRGFVRCSVRVWLGLTAAVVTASVLVPDAGASPNPRNVNVTQPKRRRAIRRDCGLGRQLASDPMPSFRTGRCDSE